MLTLDGKTILVTGASRGIGLATVKMATEAGARVLAHASGDSDAARALPAASGVAASDVIFGDLAKPGAGTRLFAAVSERAGRLDGVVNNAGIYLPTPLEGAANVWDEGWATQIAVNVQAPADLCRASIAHFRARGGGKIVNVASRAGHRGDGREFAAYAATKAALIAMTKTWARALAHENILLFAIAPGWVETRMAPQDVEARKRAVGEIPLGRVAQPEEIAALIAFLLTDACPSATGSTFDVNGASYVR